MAAKLTGNGTAIFQVQDPAMGPPTERQRTTEDVCVGTLETAQKYICELLIRNQELRMALMNARGRGPEFDYDRSIRF